MRDTTRCSKRFQEGVQEFMRMTIKCVDVRGMILCPCKDCANQCYCPINLVKGHLLMYGFNPTYTQWIFHGEDQFRVNTCTNVHTDASETIEEVDAVEELYGDVCMGTFLDANKGESSISQGPTIGANEDINSFDRSLEDGLRELYPVCKKFTKIAFILKMLHIKAICNISNKAFDMMIDLIKKALPDGETLPTSYK